MARPNDKYEPKKKALLKIALALFIEKGYDNTTITQIMKAAGLTKAGMYHYFSSKEDILESALQMVIEQENSSLCSSMQGLNAEEKMLCFIKGNAVPSSFMQQLNCIKQNTDTSYTAYRIREQTLHASIPIMEAILLEGIKQNVYQVDYPRQTAEFLILLGKALTEPSVLPAASLQETQDRINAYVQLIEKWLSPSEKHLADIRDILFKEIAAKQTFTANEEE